LRSPIIRADLHSSHSLCVATLDSRFPISDSRAFPTTRRSVILALNATEPAERRRAWDTLISAYWKPVYKHLRLSWSLLPEDAEDLTQEFFAQALEGDVLERFDPARARFRTFLRVCVDRFASNTRKAGGRLKRGGGHVHLPLDFPGFEREIGAVTTTGGDVDDAFRQETIRALFATAVDALRERSTATGKTVPFAIFERYDLRPNAGGDDAPTYAVVASEFGVPVTQVTNHLHAMRRAFRGLVLQQLREITATEEEFREEARELFGADAA
jgi:DNA-directed RNA polymerase specialized sigma24 family protein